MISAWLVEHICDKRSEEIIILIKIWTSKRTGKGAEDDELNKKDNNSWLMCLVSKYLSN